MPVSLRQREIEIMPKFTLFLSHFQVSESVFNAYDVARNRYDRTYEKQDFLTHHFRFFG